MTSRSAAELATLCGGYVVEIKTLVELGLARSTIADRCRAGGPWQRLLPGIVLMHSGPPQRDDHRRAALLYLDSSGAGPPDRGRAVLTGADALELHALQRMPRPSGPIHLLVPVVVRCSGRGRFFVERTTRLPAPVGGRWALAPVPRAALDLARRSSDRGVVRAVLAEVVQRGLCGPGDLADELAAGSDRGSALPRSVLAEVLDGVRSPAEAGARRLAGRSGLPAPLWNPRLHDASGRLVGVPDAWFDEVAMAWEIDSLEWHLGPAGYAATVERRARLMAAGIVVVHHLPSAVRDRPADVLADLRVNYANAALRPRPPLRAVPAHRTSGASVRSHRTSGAPVRRQAAQRSRSRG
jgi:hypothetical protein